MAGLGRTKIALPSQFASAFSFRRKFAVCLSSSNGVAFFGDGPYVLLPNVDASQLLTFTPLLLNPVSTASAFALGEPSAEYFIGVKSIKIDEKSVRVNTTLLSINSSGVGGTKISSVNPYTVLEASIFKAVTEAFVKASAARNITRVASVAPFEVCFSSENVVATRLGAAVPTIELVLQNQKTVWRIYIWSKLDALRSMLTTPMEDTSLMTSSESIQPYPTPTWHDFIAIAPTPH
ncbi:Basic 7S globulin 2 [Glycine max]|nr:Basic 7S globulin 2 [Glycine max]